MIEAFSGTLKKNKEIEQIKPYPVKISPDLESQISDVLSSLNITPVSVTVNPVRFNYNYIVRDSSLPFSSITLGKVTGVNLYYRHQM